MVKKFLAYLHGWRGIALTAYMWLILMAWPVIYLDMASPAMKKRFYAVTVAEVILVIALLVCPRLLSWTDGLSISRDSEALAGTARAKFFLKSWLATFGIFLLMYAIFYPGGFSFDSFNQYEQAIGMKKYNDWHPVLHTLFSFTLPLKLTGGWVGSIVLFQIVLASLALAYMTLTIAEFGNRKYSILFLAYILLNPATLAIMMYPWKDVAFAVAAMLSMIFAVRAYFSGGKSLESPANMFLFIVFISSATIFRHNAILFTFPLLIAVLFCAGRKQKIIIVTGCCVFIAAVRFVLYPYLDVQKPGNRVVETTCMPMTVIANAVNEAPEKLDKDIIDFLYSVAPKEQWQEHYVTGSFNSVKFRGINSEPIENAGHAVILGMMLRCFIQAPYASLRGFAVLTKIVYSIFGFNDWGISPKTGDNDYGIDKGGIRPLQSMFYLYAQVTRAILKQFFWHIGVLLLALVILILAKADLMKFCLAVPVIAYDFGTMLFLGGNDFRFFYVTYLVFPLAVLVLLRGGESES